MDVKALGDTPPWDWPEDARATLLRALTDDRAKPPERLLAADLAGDDTVVDDELAEALLSIVCRADAPERTRRNKRPSERPSSSAVSWPCCPIKATKRSRGFTGDTCVPDMARRLAGHDRLRVVRVAGYICSSVSMPKRFRPRLSVRTVTSQSRSRESRTSSGDASMTRTPSFLS